MTPRGSYRTGLEEHLRETRDHAERVQAAPARARAGRQNPLLAGIGFIETVTEPDAGALEGAAGPDARRERRGEAPRERQGHVRHRGAGDRDLHRAGARRAAVGDDATAKLAASIRADEEQMLERVVAELPKLARAVVRAEVEGKPSFDVAATAPRRGPRDRRRGHARPRTRSRASARRPGRTARAAARQMPGRAATRADRQTA